jgi:iron complex outermembrane receptor protein
MTKGERMTRLKPGLLVAMLAQALAETAAAQAVDSGDASGEITELDRVTVVGSRIKRVDVETSQPVFVLERPQLERTGLASVGDILQDLTTHGAALNTTFNNGGDGTTRIDLRNLGPNRTLVLVNGRRWITGIDGSVDLNSIPLPIVERIEVLKDGASSIYGSDAIAGVINITTRESYDGLEANAYVGESEHGDGQVQSCDAMIGASGERAAVAVNVSYLKQEEIFAGDRERSAVPLFGLPPNDVYAGASSTTPEGLFGFGPRSLCPFNPSGVYPGGPCPSTDGRPPNLNRNTFDPATGTYPLFDPETGGYNFAPENYLQTPQERMALYVQGRYDLSDTIGFSFEALYNERRSEQELAPEPIFGSISFTGARLITVPASHVHNPFGQRVTGIQIRPGGQVRNFSQDADTFRFGGGLAGVLELGERLWSWDLNYVYSDYTIGELNTGQTNPIRIQLALGPSFRDSAGNAICGTPDQPIAGCVPLDAFHGTAGFTRDMLDYIYYAAQAATRTSSWNYTANVTGELMDLPAGPLALAAGYEYRRESGESQLDELQIQLQGIEDTSFGGRQSVDEVYSEINLPILSDRPGARLLELNAAARYSDYDSFGDTTNFKAGLRWKPIDDLLVRGGWAEGFRAPIVSELFFPPSLGFGEVDGDPCNEVRDPSEAVRANCAADGVPGGVYSTEATLFSTRFGGNSGLQPESAVSKTLGAVWSPAAIPGLDLTLDWYEIEIEDAIADPRIGELLDFCAFEGVPEACERTTRNAAGELVLVDGRTLNSGVLRVEGYDLTVRYRLDTGYGRFEMVWDSTYYADYVFEVPRGSGERPISGNYVASEPGYRVRSNLDIAWSRGDWTAAAGLRYYPALDESCATPTFRGYLELCSKPDVESAIFFGAPENRMGSATYVDLQAGWSAPWSGRITLGVQNAFDRDPPISYSAFANSFDPSQPIPGRFWYASYSQTF